ncbi:MAG: HAD hydrolase family protein [Deltaproteobacteria bacterium]|nr:HAD hydrolase family protein [Deltaproteobacteria bacterium]
MGKSYASEIKTLSDTLTWASSLPIDVMQRFVNETCRASLVAVGSGGSSAAAHFAALLHRRVARGMSRHATPLELLLDEAALHARSVLFLSASGKNKDVLAAARAAVAAEVPSIGAICTQKGSPLASAVCAFSRGYVLDDPIPSGKDGYLATNSLLATMVIIARAYGCFDPLTEPQRPLIDDSWKGRDSVVVLHAGWSSPIATDLESRLHESALLHVQISDYRNFGHGRHLWLAQRYSSTFVLTLITPETQALAMKTLRLLPKDVPVVRLITKQKGPSATIDLLAQALHWTLKVAERLGTDPGKPTVPDFGRRLFHLAPSHSFKSKINVPLAVDRKLRRLNSTSDAVRSIYISEYESFRKELAEADIGAVVLDYDGTLVHQSERFDPVSSATADVLLRVLKLGLSIGIATGRGRSVRQALRDALPSNIWKKVYVGYYNGADVGTLADDTKPDKTRPAAATMIAIEKILTEDKLLASLATIELRPSQITVTPNDAEPRVDLHQHLMDMVLVAGVPSARVLCSAHSIDIIETETSKMAVVQQLAELVSPRMLLCIGDRGGWPGNDFELLRHRFSLSVDEVSSAPSSCWNLTPRGCLGPSATIRYLTALQPHSGAVRINLDAIEDSGNSV